MEYIKGTKQECEAYNDEVTQGENYQGSTSKWSNVIKIKDEYFILKHPKYATELEILNQLPHDETIE